ncbi:MAG: helix-turn-helix transcriptional regulator [Deltaproteobacteria bacterium]|nr:helix-turn-helix transcriptional regulator [Deltaproteobacteria bacterium]
MSPRAKEPEPSPRGREAIRAAVLAAASELFASHGTAVVSIRDIAARAGVNHGLVHRHFGTKDVLIREVMAWLGGELAGISRRERSSDASLPGTLMAALGESRYVRVLARALLDGLDVGDLQGQFPVVDALLEAARAAKKSGDLREDLEPRMVIAMAVALGLGWLLFEPFVIASAGLKKNPETLRRDLASMMLLLLRPTSSPTATAPKTP